jgi:transmembrane sensor
LMFVRTPLADAVKAFNLHGTHRLELGDPALGVHLLGGTFFADNVEAFVRLLEQGGEIRAERLENRTVLFQR